VQLAQMRDTDYLDLLKEVAGTKVYEERRKESLKLMDETKGKQKRTNDILFFIEDKLTELKLETKELDEYMLLERERRLLEYT
jgi:structural maintenance of chromosome 3 (chondroitin sulfate proteoglycan 6)